MAHWLAAARSLPQGVDIRQIFNLLTQFSALEASPPLKSEDTWIHDGADAMEQLLEAALRAAPPEATPDLVVAVKTALEVREAAHRLSTHCTYCEHASLTRVSAAAARRRGRVA